ncbi:MAG: hypothetical protein EBR82_38025 [Caulobacteraceae bacterium]|nr:hypothetical protein [Caulobacteraceae bacterium]
MAPFLVILSLLLMGVAIVAWHTRATWWHFVAHLLPQPPLTRAAKAAVEQTTEPVYTAEPDAFAHAPLSGAPLSGAPLSRTDFIAETPVVAPASASANDPFAHAPAVSDLSDGFPQSETRH